MTPDRFQIYGGEGGGNQRTSFNPANPANPANPTIAWREKSCLNFLKLLPATKPSSTTWPLHISAGSSARYLHDPWWGWVHPSLWTRTRRKRHCQGKQPIPTQVLGPYPQSSGSLDRVSPIPLCHYFGAKEGILASGWRFPARRLRPLPTRQQRAKNS